MALELVAATRTEDVEGFPTELREMLWRANFSYHPEYCVYARGRGPGLVDYLATIDIPSRIVEGAGAHFYQAIGTSEAMAIQAVAYVAMCALRRELYVLSVGPFLIFLSEKGWTSIMWSMRMKTAPCSSNGCRVSSAHRIIGTGV